MWTLQVHQPQAVNTNDGTAMPLYIVVKKRSGFVKNPSGRLLRRRSRDRYRVQRRLLQMSPTLRHSPTGTTGSRYQGRSRESRRGSKTSDQPWGKRNRSQGRCDAEPGSGAGSGAESGAGSGAGSGGGDSKTSDHPTGKRSRSHGRGASMTLNLGLGTIRMSDNLKKNAS